MRTARYDDLVISAEQWRLLGVAITKYVYATFDEGDWTNLGLETDELAYVRDHPRLLRSLSFGDPDHLGHVAEAIEHILSRFNPDAFGLAADETALSTVMDLFPGLESWLTASDPRRYRQLVPLFESWSHERPGQSVNLSAPTAQPITKERTMSQIFLVHGHDHATRDQVRLFVHGVTGVMPTVLDLEANEGKTLIEKFETNATSADVAIVLLTPDDVGSANGKDLNPRARQNVILELGWFLGALGRSRVIALNAGVESPSDIAGLVYISLTGDWREQLRRELRAMKNVPIVG